MKARRIFGSLVTASLALTLVMFSACPNRKRADLDYDHEVFQLVAVPELGEQELVQFRSVFWEPDDTASLRTRITEDRIAEGRTVLEIGCGTGLVSLLCLSSGAKRVVATDINEAAVANTRYNAALLGLDGKLDVRQVDAADAGAFAVIRPEERFDLILSNPPWEDGTIDGPADHAFYDPGFALMDSLLDGLPQHLTPGGRCLFAYGHVPAITRLLEKAAELGYRSEVLDERSLDQLPRDFLPGMLIEIRLGRNQDPNQAVSRQDRAER